MIARALIVLDPLPLAERHARTAPHETVEVVGEGGTWESAKAACQIPAGAMVLAWIRE